MLVPKQLQLNIELNSDDEVIHRANGDDNGRIVVNRFLLWIPKFHFIVNLSNCLRVEFPINKLNDYF